jgi:uncharacterized protein YceK
MFAANAFAAGPREKVLYGFQRTPDGANPSSNLIADKAGHFYGTTPTGGTGLNCEIGFNEIIACGTVFELIPPAARGDSWTEKVLYSFKGGSDGSSPQGALIIDAKGNLYGTTTFGGGSQDCSTGIAGYYPGCGTVFELSPPSTSGGDWTETILHVFQGGAADGGEPWGALIADLKGNLYGTTYVGGGGYCDGYASGCGSVFELSPPTSKSGAWSEAILYGFNGIGGNFQDGEGPMGSLVSDSKGNLYGTTTNGGVLACYDLSCGGTVFELTPPASKGGAWTETLLVSFPDAGTDASFPGPGLVFDKSGNLYGTTQLGGNGVCDNQVEYAFPSCGEVFSLSLGSGGTWTLSFTYSFTGGSDGAYPNRSGLIVDASGNLYGTTPYGGGKGSCTSIKGIFGTGCGSVFKLTPPASGGEWTETTLHAFGGGSDGGTPYGGLVLRGGILFGTTTGIADYEAATNGTVFAVVP